MQQHDASRVYSGGAPLLPRDPVGRAARAAHVAGEVRATQARVDLIVEAGELILAWPF